MLVFAGHLNLRRLLKFHFRVQSLKLHRSHITAMDVNYQVSALDSRCSCVATTGVLPIDLQVPGTKGAASPQGMHPGSPTVLLYPASVMLVQAHSGAHNRLLGPLATSFINPQSPTSACWQEATNKWFPCPGSHWTIRPQVERFWPLVSQQLPY